MKVYEHSPDPKEFVKNLIPKSKEIEIMKENGSTVAEIKVSRQDRGYVIGRSGEKIKIFKEILKRIHNISDLRVK